MTRENPNDLTLDDLFPEGGRILLTGGGREFVERIGVEAIRNSILSVMMGDNIRTQTEPLSRRKIAIVSGALVVLFLRGHLNIGSFTDELSEIVQMSLRYWVRDLAQRLGERMGVTHELQRMQDDDIEAYLKGRLD